ncbi:MAG: hypothetical protein R2855_04915 [Thermomicrobiales bacterium]
MKLSYSTWGMQTTPIDDAVRHCAALGFDGLELTIIPGWPTDATTMTGVNGKRIRRLCGDAGQSFVGSQEMSICWRGDAVANEARLRSYLDFAAEIQHPGDELIIPRRSQAPRRASGMPAGADSSRSSAG